MALIKIIHEESGYTNYNNIVVLEGEHANWYTYSGTTGLIIFDRVYAIPLNNLRSIKSDSALIWMDTQTTDKTEVSTISFPRS